MGKCGGDETKPYKFTLDDLKDLDIDKEKEMPRGCAPDAAGAEGWLKKRGFDWPQNEEFEFSGLGSGCGLCSDIDGGYGCECSGGNAVVGKRGKIKRRQFKGNHKECCLANMESKGKTKIVGNFTCDPLYVNPGSTECGNYYIDYCKQSDNLFNSNCQALKNSNESLYNNLMGEKCNTTENYKSSTCLNWCTNNSTSCTMLNNSNRCAEFQITDPECTEEKVNDTINQCKKYKIIQSDVGNLGEYSCNLNAIKTLEDECKQYNIDLDSCSPAALEQAKNRDELAQSREQNAQQFKNTQDNINKILGLEDSTTKKPEKKEDYTIYIIIMISIIILSSFSSISAFLFIRSQ